MIIAPARSKTSVYSNRSSNPFIAHLLHPSLNPVTIFGRSRVNSAIIHTHTTRTIIICLANALAGRDDFLRARARPRSLSQTVYLSTICLMRMIKSELGSYWEPRLEETSPIHQSYTRKFTLKSSSLLRATVYLCVQYVRLPPCTCSTTHGLMLGVCVCECEHHLLSHSNVIQLEASR